MNLDFEKSFWKKEKGLIFGLDEVGRGPLAGPVVAGGVCLIANIEIPEEIVKQVNDSKKLTSKKRKVIIEKIKKIPGIEFVIAETSEKEIDRVNILQATLNAFRKVVLLLEEKIGKKPSLILIDGNKKILNLDGYKQETVTRGDLKIFSIALASIVAKEYRDDLMIKYSKKYPKYFFEEHKGYGTKKHYEMIDLFGSCDLHRKTFLKKLNKKIC